MGTLEKVHNNNWKTEKELILKAFIALQTLAYFFIATIRG